MTEQVTSPPYTENDLLAALELQSSWGASSVVSLDTGALIEEEAVFVHPIELGRDTAVSSTVEQTKNKSERPSVSAAEVERRIAASSTVEELMQAVSLMREVRPLVSGASHTLAPVLVKDSKVLVIGELPSDEEDRTGELFSDEMGQYLKSMLSSIDINLDQTSRMSLSPWRLPGGRKRALAPKEVTAMRSLIGRLLALSDIQKIVTVGSDAALALVDVSKESSNASSVMKGIRGQWQNLSTEITKGSNIQVFPLSQAKQIAQSASMKRMTWHDLQRLRDDLVGF